MGKMPSNSAKSSLNLYQTISQSLPNYPKISANFFCTVVLHSPLPTHHIKSLKFNDSAGDSKTKVGMIKDGNLKISNALWKT